MVNDQSKTFSIFVFNLMLIKYLHKVDKYNYKCFFNYITKFKNKFKKIQS